MNLLELRKECAICIQLVAMKQIVLSISRNWNGTFINSLKNLINFKFRINNTTDKTIIIQSLPLCRSPKSMHAQCLRSLPTLPAALVGSGEGM